MNYWPGTKIVKSTNNAFTSWKENKDSFAVSKDWKQSYNASKTMVGKAKTMTYEEAKKILDAVREGADISSSKVRRSLWVTGDLRAHAKLRGSGVDSEVPEEDWRIWCRSRQIMVDSSLR